MQCLHCIFLKTGIKPIVRIWIHIDIDHIDSYFLIDISTEFFNSDALDLHIFLINTVESLDEFYVG